MQPSGGKNIHGRFHYFGRWGDPDGALEKYLDQKDDRHPLPLLDRERAPADRVGPCFVGKLVLSVVSPRDGSAVRTVRHALPVRAHA